MIQRANDALGTNWTLHDLRHTAANLTGGYLREHEAWAQQIARPAAEKMIRGGLSAGAQTREGERNLEGLLRSEAAGWEARDN